MRRTVLAAAVSVLALTFAAPALARPGLQVAVDHTARLHVSAPAGSVIVGNPAVADVTVVDPHTVFVSGRGYGVSEVVVLDPLGRTVWDGEVVVTQNDANQVTVYHGMAPTEMACATICTPSLRTAKTQGSSGASGAAGAQQSTSVPAPQPSPSVP